MANGPKAGETLAQKLERVRAAAHTLSQLTDQLNDTLARAEQALASLHLGVRASVDITDFDAASEGQTECIEFAKDGGAWRLLFTQTMAGAPEEHRTPILKASKEIRFAAADVLPQLVDALLNAAEQQILAARQRIDKVDQLVKEIGS